MLTPHNSITVEAEPLNGDHYLDETLIEKMWQELDEQVTREQIRLTATQVAAQFEDATVTTFIPVFVYRETYEKLKKGWAAGE